MMRGTRAILAGLVVAGLATAVQAQAPSTQPGAELAPGNYIPQTDYNQPIRLSLWDQASQTFITYDQQLFTARIAASPRVWVLTHGIAAGLRQAVDDYEAANDGAIPLFWYPQLVNGDPQGAVPWINQIAAAIMQRDPQAVVLGYSWIDDAAIDTSPDTMIAQGQAAAATLDSHGVTMANLFKGVLPAIAPPGGRKIAFMGHSFGTRVASVAAGEMLPTVIDQLTLFDGPEVTLAALLGASVNLPLVFEEYKMTPGREAGQMFTENYYSAFGAAMTIYSFLRGAVDAALTSPTTFKPDLANIGTLHVYPTAWYLDTITKDADVGWGWSPMRPGGGKPNALLYLQSSQIPPPTNELRLVALPGPPLVKPSVRDIAVTPQATHNTVTQDANGTVDLLATADDSPAEWSGKFSMDADDRAFLFGFDVLQGDDNSVLAVFIDGQLKLQLSLGSSNGAAPDLPFADQTYLDLQDLNAGDHTIVFSLFSGGTTAEVQLGKFQIAASPDTPPGVPKSLAGTPCCSLPTSSAALLAAMMLVYRQVHRRRRARAA